jgi:alpha-beta hydrolase superfamily lysophospholipase
MNALHRRPALAWILSLLLTGLAAAPAVAQTPAPPEGGIGVVVMHGKGGSPSRLVPPLASALKEQGWQVANLEMAWSGRRDYDVPVRQAVAEVDAALQAMRAQGARKLFIAGHSLGGLFTFYLGSQLKVDGLIAIAPGGSPASMVYRDKLGSTLQEARRLVAEGKGNDKVSLLDYEGSRGTYPIVTPPAAYVDWFDPAGALNQTTALEHLDPATPVLLVVPTRDYPALLRLKQSTASALPRHPQTRLYEPDASHLEAPAAAAPEIIRWIQTVAGAR